MAARVGAMSTVRTAAVERPGVTPNPRKAIGTVTSSGFVVPWVVHRIGADQPAGRRAQRPAPPGRVDVAGGCGRERRVGVDPADSGLEAEPDGDGLGEAVGVHPRLFERLVVGRQEPRFEGEPEPEAGAHMEEVVPPAEKGHQPFAPPRPAGGACRLGKGRDPMVAGEDVDDRPAGKEPAQ
jgi:hypothetical protein